MEEKVLTPMKSIRAKCLDCSCGSSKEVELCPVTNCPLYPYRFGRRINGSKKEMSEEKRQEYRERMLAFNAKRKAEEGDRGLPE